VRVALDDELRPLALGIDGEQEGDVAGVALQPRGAADEGDAAFGHEGKSDGMVPG
jgi:hypothetical protein